MTGKPEVIPHPDRIGPVKRSYRQLEIWQFPHDDTPTSQDLVGVERPHRLKHFTSYPLQITFWRRADDKALVLPIAGL
jgi:hypothetical protein